MVMNRETRKLIDGLGLQRLKALEISGSSWSGEGYFREYRSVSYPEYDVCEGPLEETFDIVIAEQVFEHLLWPYRAGRHVYQMLRPGGWFLVSTPFLIKVHLCPHDCTRWTETGIRYFLAECGFPLARVRSHSWGNRTCVKANFPRWPIYQAWRHALRNDPEFPVQVWALAQK